MRTEKAVTMSRETNLSRSVAEFHSSCRCIFSSSLPRENSFNAMQSTIVANSDLHKAFATCELIADVKEKQKNWKENAIVRERAKAVPYLGVLKGEDRAEKLDMDHVHIRFNDFLWCFVFIWPFSMLLWMKGTFVMRLRIWLIKLGILKFKECEDIEALVGKMCLELSQVINYFAKTKEESELGNIAGFFFADFPYVDNDLNFQVADLFAVDIDLDTKRFVKAKLDDKNLTASQALILLWYNNACETSCNGQLGHQQPLVTPGDQSIPSPKQHCYCHLQLLWIFCIFSIL